MYIFLGAIKWKISALTKTLYIMFIYIAIEDFDVQKML
jgi:hypothetical protein